MKFHSDWKYLQWQYVEKVANNELARIVGIIPVVGYLILFNDEIAGIASFGIIAGAENGETSPFLMNGLAKMRLVFLGSLCLFIANIIFRIFRPQVLEHSKGDLEFSTRVRDSYSVYELISMEDGVYSERWKPRSPFFWIVRGETRKNKPVVSGFTPMSRNSMFSRHGEYINFLAREWWIGMMHTACGAPGFDNFGNHGLCNAGNPNN